MLDWLQTSAGCAASSSPCGATGGHWPAATSGHFEQAFSDDGGKSWEVNWIAGDTRTKDETGAK
ncbi:MAG: hypothetical protein JSR55_03850 [Proteobacteria bacterium]|nr:hypothetical protein [Pseudomonadota bacterium]